MERRVTRKKTAQIKVEKEACQDALLSSVSETNNECENSDVHDQESIGLVDTSYTEMGSTQHDDAESEAAGEITNLQNQSPDENNNFAQFSPLKSPSPLKRIAEFDPKNDAEMNNSPSPTKQSKLENDDLNESVSNDSVETPEESEVVSGKKEEKADETEGVNAPEHDLNEQHDNEEKDLNVEFDDVDNNDQAEDVNETEQDSHEQGDNEEKDLNDKFDEADDNDQAEDVAVDDECDKEATAEEIVQKLCKNGKVLTLTEGEKYFKVIVYEDSGETKEDNDTLEQQEGFDENNNCQQTQQSLLQKIVDGDFDDEDTQSVQSDSQHILSDRTNFLTSVSSGVTQTVTPSQLISAVPLTVAESSRQWYSDVCSPVGYTLTSQAAAIQSNFTQTMNQFAPAFLATDQQDTQEPTIPLSNIENTPHIVQPAGQATASQRLFCTPHPKNGQYMFYYTDAEGNPTQASFIPFSTSTPLGRPRQRGANKSKSVATTNSVILNSSGEENQSPPDIIPSPTPTPNDKKTRARVISRTSLESDVEYIGEDGTIREQHNQKERRRRARIKEACDLMRQLVPGMSDKTDKATVFEFGARYIHFLKSFIGTAHDKDFLMKYSPY